MLIVHETDEASMANLYQLDTRHNSYKRTLPARHKRPSPRLRRVSRSSKPICRHSRQPWVSRRNPSGNRTSFPRRGNAARPRPCRSPFRISWEFLLFGYLVYFSGLGQYVFIASMCSAKISEIRCHRGSNTKSIPYSVKLIPVFFV